MNYNFEYSWKILLTAQDKVLAILNTYPVTRDNDNILVATFHKLEIGLEKFEKLTAREYLTMIIDGEIIAGDTISRARRKVQENYPDLRGQTYKDRKKIAAEFAKRIKE